MSEYTYNQLEGKDWVVTRKGISGDVCERVCVCVSYVAAREIVARLNFCAGVKVPDKVGGLKELVEWVAETCGLDALKPNESCIEACCPILELGFCNQHAEKDEAKTDPFF